MDHPVHVLYTSFAREKLPILSAENSYRDKNGLMASYTCVAKMLGRRSATSADVIRITHDVISAVN